MANIKLQNNNWEASGIYDLDQQKNQRQINAEVSKLKSALKESNVAEPEGVDITSDLTIGLFYWYNGVKTEISNVQSCEKIECHEGDTYIINAHAFGVVHQINLWDENGNWTYIDCPNGYEAYTYVCTSSNKYISFSSGDKSTYPLVVKIKTITDKYQMIKDNQAAISELEQEVDEALTKDDLDCIGNLRFISELVDGQYIVAGDTAAIASGNNTAYAKVPVRAGETVSFSTTVTGSTYNGAYFYEDETIGFFKYSSVYNSENDCYTLTVPNNCVAIGITVKLSASVDDSLGYVVLYGDAIDDDLKDVYEIQKINTWTLRDTAAREKIDDIETEIATVVATSRLYGKHITLFGDSITEYPNRWAAIPWAKVIENRTGCVLQNLGISGFGFKAGGKYNTKLNDVSQNVELIGVALSFNDADEGIGNITDTSANDTVCGYANDFLDALLTAHPTTPIICYIQNPWDNCKVGETLSDDLVDKISKICLQRGIPFYGEMYLNGSALRPWVSVNQTVYFKGDNPDYPTFYNVTNGVHPNSEGGKVIANHLQWFFEQNIV